MSKLNQTDIICIITATDGSERVVTTSNTLQAGSIKLKAGETYRFLQRVNGERLPLDTMLASRASNDLILQFDQTHTITLAEYFTLCVAGECNVELVLEGYQNYLNLAADSIGLQIGASEHLLFAYGETNDLMQLAAGNKNIIAAIQSVQQ